MGESNRPDTLRPLGWFMIAIGALGFLNGEYLRLARAITLPDIARLELVFSVWSAAAGLLWLICGIATLKRRPWAWTLAIGIVSMNCVVIIARGLLQPLSVAAGLSIALGLLLNVVFVAVMSRPSIRLAYQS